MSTTSPYYKDLDLSFEPHPATGDLMRKMDVSSVRESLKNIILSEPFDKPFYPDYGVGIKRYIFDLYTPGVAVGLKKDIREQIRIFEPRCIIDELFLAVNEEENSVEIIIQFHVIGLLESFDFNLYLERVR